MRTPPRLLALLAPVLTSAALLGACSPGNDGEQVTFAAAERSPSAAPSTTRPAVVAPAPAAAPGEAGPAAVPSQPVVTAAAPPPPPPPPPEPPRPAPAGRAADRPTGAGSGAAPAPAPAASSPYAASLAERVNAERRSAGLRALAPSGCALSAARRWADRLAATGRFAHQDVSAVLRSCAPATSAGENIVRTAEGPAGAVSAWMASPGHRANILDAGYTHGAVAAARGVDGRTYAVQIFLTL